MSLSAALSEFNALFQDRMSISGLLTAASKPDASIIPSFIIHRVVVVLELASRDAAGGYGVLQ